jgi:hypothetical protein
MGVGGEAAPRRAARRQSETELFPPMKQRRTGREGWRRRAASSFLQPALSDANLLLLRQAPGLGWVVLGPCTHMGQHPCSSECSEFCLYFFITILQKIYAPLEILESYTSAAVAHGVKWARSLNATGHGVRGLTPGGSVAPG